MTYREKFGFVVYIYGVAGSFFILSREPIQWLVYIFFAVMMCVGVAILTRGRNEDKRDN